MFDRVNRLSRRRLLQGAGGAALGLGVLGAAPGARADEQITYLFPAPPLLPAFGPIRLAQGLSLIHISSKMKVKASSNF